ncbi:AAA family ATPase [Thermomicrobiaceae bacterium CFH 74404]|uniref:AAA family ATPase n=1 Tax=Thermalbibacter longus TaxID=2951981 RepID=A0AA41WC71_9BACT|nr:AAA family ATPase [Thermalbibacter longus]MCM8750454.1 AAA family ATPase [Thermalbibacter longus]
MAQKIEPAPTTLSGQPRPRYRDDLEAQIDEFIQGIIDLFRFHLRGLILIVLLVTGFFLWLWPSRGTWGPVALMVGFALLQIAFAIVFVIIQFGAIFWFLGRGRTYWIKPGETGVGFADYKGNPEVLESARRVVTLLRGVKEFKEMGGEAIRGLLLVGPPGTGKSYLAQCISTEANVPFGYASAPSFQNMFFGVSNLRIMMLYRKARKLARKYGACILFIDEIDAIAQARGGRYAGQGFLGPLFGFGGNAMLNELLLQLDPPPQELTLIGRLLRLLGLRRRRVELPPVLTIAATNMPDALDPALLRPGRFDRKIVVDAPSAEGRREIIEYYLNKVKHDPNIPVDDMVYDTIGYTPAAIRYVINEAVIHAHFAGRNYITYEDFTAAREMHELGLRQPIKSMSYEERRRIAYHEAGHALAQFMLQPKNRVVKVSIIRHGEALGFSATKPTEERFTKTRDEIMTDIQVALASRAAEELFLGIQMSGVTNDLAQATHLANLAVSMWGMDGSLYSALPYNQMVPDLFRKQRVERILAHQFENVKRLLEANREALIALAEELLARDELNEQQIREILRQFELVIPPPLPEPVESLEVRQAQEAVLSRVASPETTPQPEESITGPDGSEGPAGENGQFPG